MRLKNTFVLATIGAMLCAATAMADDFRTRQSGDWSNSNTWEEDVSGTWTNTANIPGVGDDVLVRASHTASVDQAVTVNSLHITDDGVVDFGDAVMLEITDPAGFDIDPAGDGSEPGLLNINFEDAITRLSGGGTHPVEGDIFVSAPNASFQVTGSNSTLSNSSGAITLSNATAAIKIEGGVKLTIGSLFFAEGYGKIQRLSGSTDAQFQNDGLVHANVGGETLELAANVALMGSGTWKASTNANARLLFSYAFDCQAVTGDFMLSDSAIMTFDATCSTSGDFTCTNGGTVNGSGSLTEGASGGSCTGGSPAAGC